MLQAVGWRSPALEDLPLSPDRLQSLDVGKTDLLWPQDHGLHHGVLESSDCEAYLAFSWCYNNVLL